MKHDNGLSWLGFWIFLAAFIICDNWTFQQGYDTFFQHHKTQEEKALQKLKIELLRQKAGKCDNTRLEN